MTVAVDRVAKPHTSEIPQEQLRQLLEAQAELEMLSQAEAYLEHVVRGLGLRATSDVLMREMAGGAPTHARVGLQAVQGEMNSAFELFRSSIAQLRYALELAHAVSNANTASMTS